MTRERAPGAQLELELEAFDQLGLPRPAHVWRCQAGTEPMLANGYQRAPVPWRRRSIER